MKHQIQFGRKSNLWQTLLMEPGHQNGQESVWDYPRPPRIEPNKRHLEVEFDGILIADTKAGYRVLETSHPPVYYFPPQDVLLKYFESDARTTFCEWKGKAQYFTIVMPNRRIARAAWSYATPRKTFLALADHLAFYPGKADQCRLDGEIVQAQPGDFYGGWITRDIEGPFKGSPGTLNW